MTSTKKCAFIASVVTLFVALALFKGQNNSSPVSQNNSASRSTVGNSNDPKRTHAVHLSPPTAGPAVGPTAASSQSDERFPGSIVLDSRDEISGPNGRLTRLQLVQTKMKYPFLRVENVFERDAAGNETLLHRREMVADHVVVELKPGHTETDLLDAISAVGGSIRRKLQLDYASTYLIALPHPTIDAVPEATRKLGALKDVFNYAEPDFVSHKTSMPNDPQFNAQWHLSNSGQTGGTAGADIDATNAWSLVTGSDSLVIAISDTGVDYNHSDLHANIWSNPNEVANGSDDDGNGFVDDFHGWNFVSGNNDPWDDEGHGTFVAGVIGARGNNGTGIAGVCWQCKMVAVKVLDQYGSGYNTDIAQGYDYARRLGVKIINSSHAGPTSLTIQSAVNALENAGVILAAAADNDSRNEDIWRDYPACYTNRNVISVGASDDNDNVAYFSNWGATTVDLFAPGDSLWSTQPGNKYGSDSGTSFATPQVAAVAGLLRVAHPTMTYLDIKDAILNSVDMKDAFIGKCVSGGRLNAFRALAGMYNNAPGNIDLRLRPQWTVSGAVTTMVLQPNNRLVVGGTFTNSALHRIARFYSDGTLDTSFTTGSGANGAVNSVALQPDGKILLGGAFTRFNTAARSRVARLNVNGTLDTTFNPGTGANGTISSVLLLPDGHVVIGGNFSTFGGASHENIALLNSHGVVENSFNPSSTGVIQYLALQPDGKILFAGDTIGRLNADGTVDATFNANSSVNATIRTLAVDGNGSILIGGDFTSYNGTQCPHIARILSDGSLDGSFNPGTGADGSGATVSSIAVQDDCSILVSGNFTDFNDGVSNGLARPGIVRLSSSGAVDETFTAGLGDLPGANAIIPLTDGRAYLGGAFTAYNSVVRRYVARIYGRDGSLGIDSFTLSTTNISVPASSGSTSIGVSTVNCAAWKTFINSNNWAALVDGAVGLGSGNVVLAIAPNTNLFTRSTVLTIAGQTVTVTQQAAFVPQSFNGRTLVVGNTTYMTSLAGGTFNSLHGGTNDSGTFTYDVSNPTNASITITDSQGEATVTLNFTSATGGTFSDTRGGSGMFTLYLSRPDLNGDGRSDFLWASSTNTLRAWFMDGTNFVGATRAAATKKQSTAWKLLAANDFTGDGQTDLLWQNGLGNLSIWEMNQTNYVRTIPFGMIYPWRVIGMADLNNDDKKDLVFENPSTGALLCWFLNGTNRLGQARLNNAKPAPLSLKPIGFDDFNGDGQPDLLWQSTADIISVWLMSGTNVIGTNVLNNGQPIDSGWRVVGINDFNNDGKPDLLFESSAGALWIWLLNGTNTIDSFWLQGGETVDPKWRLASPK